MGKELSDFERSKAEAEAKKARHEKETAEVLDDFMEYFGGPSDTEPPTGSQHKQRSPEEPEFPSKRAKTGPAFSKSTRLSLQPLKGPRRMPDDEQKTHASNLFGEDDDDDEFGDDGGVADDKNLARLPRPILLMQILPPGITEDLVRKTVPSSLKIESIEVKRAKVLPWEDTSFRYDSAIITLSHETRSSDVDTAINKIQGRYMGSGFNLIASKHSTAATLDLETQIKPISGVSRIPNPFMAVPDISEEEEDFSRAPPQTEPHSGPRAFRTSARMQSHRPPPLSDMVVHVKHPLKLVTLRVIHQIIEQILGDKDGHEVEAMLMNNDDIRMDEDFSFLYNARSRDGVYYRWRLWEMASGLHLSRYQNRKKGTLPAPERYKFHEDGPWWIPPPRELEFEYVAHFDEFVNHPDYDTDEEEEEEYLAAHVKKDRSGKVISPEDDPQQTWLGPLQQAKLIFFLSHLPTTTGRLRKGDIATISAFAVKRSSRGSDEIVDILVRNILRPLSLMETAKTGGSEAIKERERMREEKGKKQAMKTQGSYWKSKPEEELDVSDNEPTQKPPPMEQHPDYSEAMKVGLYVVNDLLSMSITCGVRHSWRYRGLIEAALQAYDIFGQLGRLDRDLGWGIMKADRWKNSIQQTLDRWEEWSIFDAQTHRKLVHAFKNPPLTEEEKKAEQERKAAPPPAAAPAAFVKQQPSQSQLPMKKVQAELPLKEQTVESADVPSMPEQEKVVAPVEKDDDDDDEDMFGDGRRKTAVEEALGEGKKVADTVAKPRRLRAEDLFD